MRRRQVDWGGRLPPGAAGDPNAPWNEPEPPTCPECENMIVDPGDHDGDCPMGDAEPVDIAEYRREQNRKTYDDVKDEQGPPDTDDE